VLLDPVGEDLRVGQVPELPKKSQFAGLELLAHGVQEDAPKETRQHPNWQEEAFTGGHPAIAV